MTGEYCLGTFDRDPIFIFKEVVYHLRKVKIYTNGECTLSILIPSHNISLSLL